MRRIHSLLTTTTGCLFLLSSGWVCNGQAIAEDSAPQNNAAVLQAAVNAAVADEMTSVPAPVVVAQAEPAAAAEAVPAPATKPGAPASTDLSATTAAVGADGMVEQFNAQDLDISTVLRILAERSKRNIVASKEVKGTVTVNLYDVTLHQALEAILEPNGYGYIEKGNFIYVYTQKELEEIRKRDRKPLNKIYKLKYVTAKDAGDMIKPLLSSNAVIALTPAPIAGVPSGTVETGGPAFATEEMLIVSDYKENHEDIDKALKEIDVRPKQVLIESTILRATLSDTNALGVDFIGLSGIDFSTLSSVAGGAGGGGSVSPRDVANTFATENQFNIDTDFASQVPSGGLSIGFLGNNISVFIRALEEISDTNIVANPKIMALNKHVGRVQIGDELGYRGGRTSTTTSTTETVEKLETGVILTFRPFIMDDDYVRLEVVPEDSAGRINAAGLPEKQKTQVISNLMLKDGRTAVIGGLFREQTTAARGQVPILGNIPILGVPFRRTNDTISRVETIILLTPHIINDDTSLYEESEKRQQDVQRMMLGNRAGLQPWGRERLATTWFNKALEAKARGNREKAIMYTDWALNTNPRFLEAIRLREELTHQRLEEVDQSTISTFIRDVVNNEKRNPSDLGVYPTPSSPVNGAATKPAE